jgi:hypothetical protein
MASGDRIYHNPNLQSQVRNWRIVAENVGRGSDADWVHGAFMASASHRAIILDGRVTELGVGSFRKGGLLYVVEVFRLPKSAAAPVAAPRPAPPPRRAAAPPAPAPAPAPAPVVAPPPPEPPPAVDPAMIGLLDKIVAPPAPAQQLVRHSASLPPSPSQRAWRVGLAVSTLLVASALLRGAVASVVIRRPRLARD